MAAAALVILSSSPHPEYRHFSSPAQRDRVSSSPLSTRPGLRLPPTTDFQASSPSSRQKFTTAASLLSSESPPCKPQPCIGATGPTQLQKGSTAIKKQRSETQTLLPAYCTSKASSLSYGLTKFVGTARRSESKRASDESCSTEGEELLGGACKRRKNASPPRKGSCTPELTCSPPSARRHSSPSESIADGDDLLQSLKARFGFGQGDTDCFGARLDPLRRSPPAKLDRKAQRSDLMKASKPKVVKSVAKTKAPKERKPRQPKSVKEKRPKSLTERATLLAAAQLAAQQAELATPVAIELDPEKDDEATTLQVPVDRRSRTLVAAKGLLSPGSGIKKAQQLDVLFGTSSQLADVPLLPEQLGVGRTRTSGTMSSIFRPTKSLWDEAARNTSGALEEIEVINLASSSPAQPKQKAVPKRRSPSPAKVSIARTRSPAKASKKVVPATTIDSANNKPISTAPSDQSAAAPSMPNFFALSDAQLMKEVTKCGFKATKNRKRLIEIAEQCWEGKQRLRSQSRDPEPLFEQQQQQPAPKRARGRPPGSTTGGRTKKSSSSSTKTKPFATSTSSSKVTKASQPPPSSQRPLRPVPEELEPTEAKALVFNTISSSDEADDLDSDLDLALVLSDIEEEDPWAPPISAPLDLSTSSARPHPQITRAVLSQPLTHNMRAPSWREKILLYDPVGVEDLTAWLNREGLGTVGIDEEVGVREVREWAESRGVCCVASLTRRGRERKRL